MRSPSKRVIMAIPNASLKVAERTTHWESSLAAGLLAATLLAYQSRASESASSVTNTPVVMRHVDGTNFGFLLAGDKVFFCTNQTSQVVILSAPAIEIKSGSIWVTNSGPYLQTIRFVMAGSNSTTLEPHQGGYCIIRFAPPSRPPHPPGLNFITAPPPTGSAWRIRAQVQNKLTGLADASTRARISAYELRRQGNSKISLDRIWSQSASSYGIPITTIITEEMAAP